MVRNALTALKTGLVPLTAVMFLLQGNLAVAQESAPKPPKIFTSDDVIAATIDAPWRTIARFKEKEDSWDGLFSYADVEGRKISIPVKITTRGLTRKRVCDFPPLRLDFDKEAAKGTAFRGAGNLKLVTHCFANSKYEQYYIKEYLAYRVYNLMTDKSYRVQGLDLAYADSERGSKPMKRFGFLIEDPDDVAKRNDLKKLKIDEISPSRLDALETSRFMMFQYLISNLDWSALSGPKASCCHNARLIGESIEAPILFSIPYDLDSAGLINAHYAAPPSGIRVRNTRQRLYRGFCVHNDSVETALAEYRARQDDIIGLFENEERLTSAHRSKAIKFIEQYYEALEEPDDVQEKLIDNCRG